MSKLYLITGFLGAGKTTFLKELVRCFPGQKLALIINEFGREGVDGTLLAELGVALAEIDNGSIFCACRLEQFKEVLTQTLAQGPDVILVEASGLSDPTNVGKILRQEGAFPGLSYAGAICLVDGARFHKVYATARVVKLQLAVGDLVVLNKADLATPEQLAQVRALVAAQKPGLPVYETSFGKIDPAWLGEMEAPAQGGSAQPHVKDITLQKLTLTLGEGFTPDTLRHFIAMFAEDTYRIKGFVALEGALYLADCVGPLVTLAPYGGEGAHVGRLTVLFGNGLPAHRSIEKAMEWYPQCGVALS